MAFRCTNCGKFISINDDKCKHCGHPIDKSKLESQKKKTTLKRKKEKSAECPYCHTRNILSKELENTPFLQCGVCLADFENPNYDFNADENKNKKFVTCPFCQRTFELPKSLYHSNKIICGNCQSELSNPYYQSKISNEAKWGFIWAFIFVAFVVLAVNFDDSEKENVSTQQVPLVESYEGEFIRIKKWTSTNNIENSTIVFELYKNSTTNSFKLRERKSGHTKEYSCFHYTEDIDNELYFYDSDLGGVFPTKKGDTFYIIQNFDESMGNSMDAYLVENIKGSTKIYLDYMANTVGDYTQTSSTEPAVELYAILE